MNNQGAEKISASGESSKNVRNEREFILSGKTGGIQPEKPKKKEIVPEKKEDGEFEEKKLFDELARARDEYARIDYRETSAVQRIRKYLSSNAQEKHESPNVATVRMKYEKALKVLKDYKMAKVKKDRLEGDDFRKEMEGIFKYFNYQELINNYDAHTKAKMDYLEEKAEDGSILNNIKLQSAKFSDWYNKKVPSYVKLGLAAATFIPGMQTYAVGKRAFGAYMMAAAGGMQIDNIAKYYDRFSSSRESKKIIDAGFEKSSSEKEKDKSFEYFDRILDGKIASIGWEINKRVLRSKINKYIALTSGVLLGGALASNAIEAIGQGAAAGGAAKIIENSSSAVPKNPVGMEKNILGQEEFHYHRPTTKNVIPPASKESFVSKDISAFEDGKGSIPKSPEEDSSGNVESSPQKLPEEKTEKIAAKKEIKAHLAKEETSGTAKNVRLKGVALEKSISAEKSVNFPGFHDVEVKIGRGGNFWAAIENEMDKLEPGANHDDATKLIWHDAIKEYAQKNGMTFDQAVEKLSKIRSGTRFSMVHDAAGWHAHFDDDKIKFMKSMKRVVGAHPSVADKIVESGTEPEIKLEDVAPKNAEPEIKLENVDQKNAEPEIKLEKAATESAEPAIEIKDAGIESLKTGGTAELADKASALEKVPDSNPNSAEIKASEIGKEAQEGVYSSDVETARAGVQSQISDLANSETARAGDNIRLHKLLEEYKILESPNFQERVGAFRKVLFNNNKDVFLKLKDVTMSDFLNGDKGVGINDLPSSESRRIFRQMIKEFPPKYDSANESETLGKWTIRVVKEYSKSQIKG